MRAFFHPHFAVVADVLAITGKQPTLGLLDIAMFDRIVMDVVETCPKISLAPDASIPIGVPNGSAACVIQSVQLESRAPIEPLHEFSKIKPVLRKKEEVIMVCENDPCHKFRVELGDQCVECFDPQIEMRVGR